MVGVIIQRKSTRKLQWPIALRSWQLCVARCALQGPQLIHLTGQAILQLPSRSTLFLRAIDMSDTCFAGNCEGVHR